MRFILISVLLFCAVFAAPPESKSLEHGEAKNLNDQIKEMLENLKKQLPCGFPDMGIPPLVPYRRPYTEVQFEHALFSILGIFTDSDVNGLNDYTVNDIKFSIFTLKATFDINFNKIHTLSDYILNLFLIKIMKINGEGDLDIILKDLRINGSAQISANDNGLFIKNFNVILTLGNIKSNISGLLGGGLFGKLANRSIEKFTLYFIQNQQELISELIRDSVVPEINNFLYGKSIKDLMEIINSGNKPVECIPPVQ